VSVDVVVVGAGPAGLSAAVELRRLGVGSVLVADRESEAGGVPRHCFHTGFGLRDRHRVMTGPAYARALASSATAAGAELRLGTTVTGLDAVDPDTGDFSTGDSGMGGTVTLTSGCGVETVRAAAVLLATGCRERPRAARLVPGDRPAGVMTTGELQQRVYLGHERLAGRALVVGAEHVSFSAAVTLAHAGARVVAMVTEHGRQQSYAAFRLGAALRWRVPVWTRTAVGRLAGRGRLAGVEVTDVRTGAARFVPCEVVVFTGNWIPDHELAWLAGLVMDPGTRGPVVDTRLETSAPGVFGAGNLVHAAETADIAALSGRHAARHIAAALGAGARRPDARADAARVPVRVEAPLRWISPNAIACAPPPLGRFVLRSQEFRSPLRLEVRQDGRLLARSGLVRLVPGRPLHLGAAWLARVDPAGGPVRVTTGSRQDGRELRFYLVRLSREAPVTTGPEDHRAAARRGSLRASHADREDAIEALKAAYVAGRLTEDEFEARMGQAFASRTRADLAIITADIPAGPVAVPSARTPDRVVAAGTAAVIAAAALGGAVLIGGSALILWAITMTGVLLFTVSVLLNERQQRRSGKRPPRSVPGAPALKGGRPGRIGPDPTTTPCVAT
jgi:thioredoxin reductase